MSTTTARTYRSAWCADAHHSRCKGEFGNSPERMVACSCTCHYMPDDLEVDGMTGEQIDAGVQKILAAVQALPSDDEFRARIRGAIRAHHDSGTGELDIDHAVEAVMAVLEQDT